MTCRRHGCVIEFNDDREGYLRLCEAREELFGSCPEMSGAVQIHMEYREQWWDLREDIPYYCACMTSAGLMKSDDAFAFARRPLNEPALVLDAARQLKELIDAAFAACEREHDCHEFSPIYAPRKFFTWRRADRIQVMAQN